MWLVIVGRFMPRINSEQCSRCITSAVVNVCQLSTLLITYSDSSRQPLLLSCEPPISSRATFPRASATLQHGCSPVGSGTCCCHCATNINFRHCHSKSGRICIASEDGPWLGHPPGLRLVHKTHIDKTVSSCFAALRQICIIRQSLAWSALKSLVVTLVMSRLDDGSSTLVGLLLVSARQTASHAECHSSVQSTEVWPHYTDVAWTSLAPHTFRLVGSHSASIPGLWTSSCHRLLITTMFAASVDICTDIVPPTWHPTIGNRAVFQLPHLEFGMACRRLSSPHRHLRSSGSSRTSHCSSLHTAPSDTSQTSMTVRL